MPAERRAVGVVALIGMLRMFGLFALLPVLALYAREFPGATPLLIGHRRRGAYGLTQAGLQIPLGALSDRIGRVPVIVGGLVVFALGSLIAAFSDTIWGVIAGRLLQGAGAISATLTALIADATRDDVRTRSMAVFGIGVGLAFMLAMIFGPLFSARFGVPALFLVRRGTGDLRGCAADRAAVRYRATRRAAAAGFSPAFRADLLRLDFLRFPAARDHDGDLRCGATTVCRQAGARRHRSLEDVHWRAGGVPAGNRAADHPRRAPGQGHYFGGHCRNPDSRRSARPHFHRLRDTPCVSQVWSCSLAGFNFLEAGLPARLSLVAEEDSRGASLGVFSTAQFLGAFVGGLIGGRFLAAAAARPTSFSSVRSWRPSGWPCRASVDSGRGSPETGSEPFIREKGLRPQLTGWYSGAKPLQYVPPHRGRRNQI